MAVKKYEYGTTDANLTELSGNHAETFIDDLCPTPKPPDDNGGWDLKAAAVHHGRIIWSWQREISPKKGRTT